MNKNIFSRFNQPGLIQEGWYWAIRSMEVRHKKVIPCQLMGRNLAIYRGEDSIVRVVDAFCPHMGAHLAEGTVEGNSLRCFFHRWCFNEKGACTDIPCMEKPLEHVRLKHWNVRERYGLVWVWVGEGDPPHDVPKPLDLGEMEYDWSLGNRFQKECHPHVVMINAIDEQHFQSVHRLPGSILQLEPRTIDQWCQVFDNTKPVPKTSWIMRFFSRFYKGTLFYQMNYWYGAVGTTSLGPDFLHLHLMFALRHREDGKTEGQTIAFTKKRKTAFGKLLNRVILFFTKMAGMYFAYGDTKIFKTIRFHLANPIAADRSVIAFMHHVEKQKLAEWRK
jgi:phenylpropionate dioxygenase-like ring-hydroxylating dioxygenase large terminal subunit